MIELNSGTLPAIQVDVDFVNDPTSGVRTWTDITRFVRSVSYTRDGRTDELGRTEPGTLTMQLDNRTGRFDQTNAAGAYYPNVKRFRWCRITAQWAGVTYPRWQGLIDSWVQKWPSQGRDAVTDVTGTTITAALNLTDLVGLVSRPAEFTGDRVQAVLDYAGVTGYTIDTGVVSVAADVFVTGTNALQHLQEVENTEGGLLFAEADGAIRFQARRYRQTNANSVTSRGVFADQGRGETARYGDDVAFTYDGTYMWNQAGVTPLGGTEESWEDATAVAAYFPRRLTEQIQSASQAEALNRAQYLVQRHADPAARIPSVSLIGAALPASSWPLILSLKNSERVTFKRFAAANAIVQDVYVERISETVTPSSWQTSMNLSPVDTALMWLAGSGTASQAGQTTWAAY